MNHSELPGTDISLEAIMPPVQLSATAILRPLAFSSSAHTSCISLPWVE